LIEKHQYFIQKKTNLEKVALVNLKILEEYTKIKELYEF
tara:strand:- start:1684 stop:1800 length:117 start_codon:yes stop_codon:yes gene_type:complete